MSVTGRSVGPSPRVVGPVAVIVPRFPSVTGAALLREVNALERQGIPVILVALERDEPGLVPEEAEGWIERAWSLRLVSPSVIAANVRVLVRHPSLWLGTLCRLTWDARSDASRAGSVLSLYLGSVELGARLRTSGVRHVHAHDAELPALVARIASRVHDGADIPASVTVHGHDIAISHAGLGTRLEGSSFIRCTSHHAMSSLRAALGSAMPDAKTVMVRRGIAPPGPPAAARRALASRPGHERALRVLCVARLEPQKGINHLLAALRLLGEGAGGLRRLSVECTVVGEGSERASLERLARSMRIDDRVTFPGARSQREVAHALGNADVFVLPSAAADDGRVEGLPAALIEAMAAGTPIIATRMSGIPELVINEETGLLVEPEDPHALATALLRIADDQAGAERRAARGREHVLAEFALDATASDLATEFERAGAAAESDPVIADIARASAALLAPGASRVGVARVLRGESGVVLELRLAMAGGSEPDLKPCGGGTRWLARRRDERASGSPVAEARALAALGASKAMVSDDASWPGLPRAMASDAAGRLEIISHVDGADLGILLRRGRWRRGDPDLAVSLAGEWLGRFERIPLPPGDSAARERDAITARILHEAEADARRCVDKGLAEPLVDRALQLCVKELREGLLGAPCWSHGSFVPENVVVSGLDMLFDGIEAQVPRPGGHRRVTAIGLGGLRPGMPGEDAATLLESLAILVPGLASLGLLRARRHELERMFLEGRDGMRPSAPTPALRAAKLLALAARVELPSGALRRRFLLLRLSTRILELTT